MIKSPSISIFIGTSTELKKAAKKLNAYKCGVTKKHGTMCNQEKGKSKKLDNSVEINPRPQFGFTESKTNKKMGYSLGFIPFWRLDNNKNQVSGLKPIKDLIDDYDLMQCGLSNNLADFDTPFHVVTGFQGDSLDELQQNLKNKENHRS